MDRGAWQATVHAVAKSQTRLSDFHSLILAEQQEKSEGPGFLCFFLSDKMTPQFGFVNSSRAVSADCGHQLPRTLGAWFKVGFCTSWIFLHLLESPLQLKMLKKKKSSPFSQTQITSRPCSPSAIVFAFNFLAAQQGLWANSSPIRGLNPLPLHSTCGVPPSRPPGKSYPQQV